ncbi:NACHT domain-containing protein [Herbidospora mongoliensis]|uniref:NACHT domain-containing protein n=1 Tax=Herbidospora mongoliensis TaxID=688067 RepID=UPI00082D0DDE|nr:NACHT domain-containing protein [Herbidospora mongoliensis]
MAKRVTYADAVKLLGGQSRTIKALDTALGLGLLAGGPITLSLFDAKTEALRLAHQIFGDLREKVSRVPRATRTERLVAAHEVIITTAFFEALDNLDLPVPLKDLKIEGPAAQLMSRVRRLHGCLIGSDPTTPTSAHLNSLMLNYAFAGVQLQEIIEFLPESSADSDRWQALMYAFSHDLPQAAVARYQDLYYRLATDFPEFAFWAQMRAHESAQAGLAGLESMLMEVTAGRAPSAKVASIHALNAAAPIRPISQSDDQLGDLGMPSLGEAYVVPLFRRLADPGRSDLSLESTWEREETRGDLGQVLAGHLTSAEAVQAPLLILGQPGAGKSVLTQMLAARLPQSDFLPIRVPLRQVPADAGIQEQIETGIHATTGETLSWPDLARAAEGALPVVLLDGLDELLQATGVNRADYLRQAMEFQEREALLGRPLAVIITTRTAVADRCRVPPESVALRLEPFSDDQVAEWVGSWNRSTGADLSLHDVLCYPDLARQPLLLLMLALYDSDGAVLTGRLLQSELYERLVRRFAVREIRKHERGLAHEALDAAVEFELLRLSVAAFAMFNRGQQWVTHDELNRDLNALMPEAPATTTGFQRPLTAAQKVLGRFFFVHQAQARQDTDAVSTYEFLHATFGEYLVARLIRDLVQEEAELEARPSRFRPPAHTNLEELLSFAVVAVRTPILRFLAEMRVDDPRIRPALLRMLQSTYFGSVAGQSEYQPVAVSSVHRVARRSANLVLLLVILTGPTRAKELFGGREPRIALWQNLVDLWRAGTTGDEWPAVNDWLAIARTWEGEQREITVTRFDQPVADGLSGTGDVIAWTHNVLPRNAHAYWDVRPAQTSLDTGLGRQPINALARMVFYHQPTLATSYKKSSRLPANSFFGPLLEAWLMLPADQQALDNIETISPWMERRLLDLVYSDRHHLPIEVVAEICDRQLRISSARISVLLDCVLYVVARDRDHLELVDRLMKVNGTTVSDALLATVTLMELEIDPSAAPVLAFDVVRRMSPDDFDEIASADPHLLRRARRIIRAEGGRYRLTWPGSSPAPSE